MNWMDWILMPQNQFVVVFALLINSLVYQFAYKRGERVGYEDGMRILYRTIVLNDPDFFKKRSDNDTNC